MALISNPHLFCVPSFRFDDRGTFFDSRQVVNPRPEKLFHNIQSVVAINDFKSLSNRESIHESAFLITLDRQPSPLVFVSFMEAYMPLYWQCELLSPQKLGCDESTYTQFLKENQTECLLFNSFGKYMRPLQLHADGRLLEIMLFLVFLEADESKTSLILERLHRQSLQTVVSINWSRFVSRASVDLNNKSGSLSAMLSKQYRFVGEAIESLMPKRNGKFGFFKNRGNGR